MQVLKAKIPVLASRKKPDISLDDGVPAWTEGITGLITGGPAMVSCFSCGKDCAESVVKKIENEFHCPKCWKKETAGWLSVSSITGMKKRGGTVGKGGTKIPEEPKKNYEEEKGVYSDPSKEEKAETKAETKSGAKAKAKSEEKAEETKVSGMDCLFVCLFVC